MISVFDYSDYRAFLKDFYEDRKKISRSFSYRWYARQAGFASPVFIKLVMDGKSKLSEKSALALGTGLGLSEQENIYFCTLVRFTQSSSDDERQEHLATLRSLGQKYGRTVLDAQHYDYYSQWSNAALREILPAVDPDTPPEVLGSLLLPTQGSREVKRAIALLESLDLITKDPDGRYVQKGRIVSTGSEVESLAIRSYHGTMAELARDAIENVPRTDRDISGLTLGVSAATSDLIRARLRDLRDDIVALVSQDSAPVERVYRLNLQYFPLSRNLPPPHTVQPDDDHEAH